MPGHPAGDPGRYTISEAEMAIDSVAARVAGYAHRMIWTEGDLSTAQARLAWLTVIQKMLMSTWIDAKSTVVGEEISAITREL